MLDKRSHAPKYIEGHAIASTDSTSDDTVNQRLLFALGGQCRTGNVKNAAGLRRTGDGLNPRDGDIKAERGGDSESDIDMWHRSHGRRHRRVRALIDIVKPMSGVVALEEHTNAN